VLDADFTDDDNEISDVENAVTYTGRALDLDTGLYHFRNRDYGAEIGRFCQPVDQPAIAA
jgi:RHS repeat-associated protein